MVSLKSPNSLSLPGTLDEARRHTKFEGSFSRPDPEASGISPDAGIESPADCDVLQRWRDRTNLNVDGFPARHSCEAESGRCVSGVRGLMTPPALLTADPRRRGTLGVLGPTSSSAFRGPHSRRVGRRTVYCDDPNRPRFGRE
jgi:hypothetical protein